MEGNLVPQRVKQALLLIDFQNDFLSDMGRMPIARNQVESVLAAANGAIVEARRLCDPIVAIGNEFPPGDWLGNLLRRSASVEGSWGARWDERVQFADVYYLPKSKSSAFSNSSLEVWLKAQGIEHLNIAGMFAKACITATTKDALARGYSVTLIFDAIACASDSSRRRALDRLIRLGAATYVKGDELVPQH